MVKLVAKSACADLLPRRVARFTISEIDLGPLTQVAPFHGKAAELSAQFGNELKMPLPEPRKAHVSDHGRFIWFGRDAFMLCGIAAPAVSHLAALSDQSDAWASIKLEGDGLADVLARLVPVDLRRETFPAGNTVRTLLGHMSVSITALEQDTFLIMVFRSMATTLVEELQEAMEAVAARG